MTTLPVVADKLTFAPAESDVTIPVSSVPLP